jgi:tRNA-(ms[2]io[6]A)-hydroxylase
MTGLCREELQHFAQVHALLERRGVEYRALQPSPYAAELMGGARRAEPGRLLDHLLVAALIEARSCERFERLAEGLADRQLGDFYGRLAEAEARHYETYVELAEAQAGPAVTEARLQELAAAEARAAGLPTTEPRLHNSFGLL